MIHTLCALATTAASVAVAWPHLRPAALRAQRIAGDVWEWMPGPPGVVGLPELTAEQAADVRLSYVPEGWK